MRIDNTQKRGRGRPPTDATQIGLRLSPALLAALDSGIAEQKGNPGRPEAIRRLLAVQLARRQPKVLNLASPSDGPRARLTPKRRGAGLETRTFFGNSGASYLVFRTSGSYHVLTEVDAKEAARDCGARKGGSTRAQWKALWDAK